jgi:hypothetical protein
MMSYIINDIYLMSPPLALPRSIPRNIDLQLTAKGTVGATIFVTFYRTHVFWRDMHASARTDIYLADMIRQVLNYSDKIHSKLDYIHYYVYVTPTST